MGGQFLGLEFILLSFIKVSGRTIIESPPLDGVTLREVFSRYGKSARHCYALARSTRARNDWESRIPPILQQIPDLSQFVQKLKGSPDYLDEAVLKTPSQIITIIPNQDRYPEVALVSRHIGEHLYRAILYNNAANFWALFNMFWSVPETHTSAGGFGNLT